MSEIETIKKMKYELQAEMNTFLTKVCNLDMESKTEMTPLENKPFNMILGGGIPIGNLVMLIGRSGGGKSTLAAQLLANNQRKYGENHISLYFDSENTITPARLAQLGISNPPVAPVQNFTLEDLFKTIYNIAQFRKEKKQNFYTTIIWDSLSNTLTNKEIDSSDPKEVIGYKQRFMSLYLPKVINVCKQNNITLIMINQLRDKVNLSFMPTQKQLKYLKGDKIIPGGNAVIFNSAQVIKIDEGATLKPEEWGEQLYGHEVNVMCIKNKFYASGIPIKLLFDFKYGILMDWSLYMFLREHKKIKPGAYHKLEGYVDENGKPKSWRKLNFPKLYNEDETFRKLCHNAFNEIEIEFRKKYVGDVKIEYKETEVTSTDNIQFKDTLDVKMPSFDLDSVNQPSKNKE